MKLVSRTCLLVCEAIDLAAPFSHSCSQRHLTPAYAVLDRHYGHFRLVHPLVVFVRYSPENAEEGYIFLRVHAL
jgi:hypothetical protein